MTTPKTAVIKPGLLVSLKSTIAGGVSYKRVDLEHQQTADQDVSRWETTRVVEDPEEHKAATQVRSKALTEIRKLCSATSFGLLCPTELEASLDAAIIAARKMVNEHNDGATFTRVSIYVLKGRIASTDEEAARAIIQEMSELVTTMNKGIDKLDPKAIREAADRAREMSAMLGDEKRAAIEGAIEAARKAARQIVKRIEKEGEDAAIVMADIQRGALEKARIAFLDMEDVVQNEAKEALPAVERQRFADLGGDEEADERATLTVTSETQGEG